jgi:cell division protein FtsZ
MLINITGGRDITLQEVNEAVSLAHDAADPEANIIFGSLIDESSHDEVKITIIATGFIGREAKVRAAAVPVQVPLLTRPATPLQAAQLPQASAAPVANSVVVTAAPAVPVLPHREEVATLVPSKPGARTLSAEHPRAAAPRPAPPPRDASLSLDEDQFDIPTFLRRQGHTELP